MMESRLLLPSLPVLRSKPWLVWGGCLAAWAAINWLLFFLLSDSSETLITTRYTPSAGVLTAFAEGSKDSGLTLPYRVAVPESTKRLPLLIFLHGAGERGADNQAQLKDLPEEYVRANWKHHFPCLLLGPQCPAGSDWQQEMKSLEALVDHWRADRRVDPKRIYLTGLSMGGYGTWALAARHPHWFSAIVPICGGGDPQSACLLHNLPIRAVHGADDKVIPIAASRQMIAAIKACGGTPQLDELVAIGHDAWTQTYRNKPGVITWLFHQHMK